MKYSEYVNMNREAIYLVKKSQKELKRHGWSNNRFPIVGKTLKEAEEALKLSVEDLKKKREEMGEKKFNFWLKKLEKNVSDLKGRLSAWEKTPTEEEERKKKEDLDESTISLREEILEMSGVLEEGIKLFKNSKDARKKLEELKIKTYALNMKFSTKQKDLLKKAIKLLTKAIDELEDLEDKYLDTDDKEKKKEFKAEHKKLVDKYKEETKKALNVDKFKYAFKKTSADELAVIFLLSTLFAGIGLPFALIGANIYRDKVVHPRQLKKAEKGEKDEEELENKENLKESILHLAGLVE